MSYLALYRQWRPQTFDQVAGQSHITRTLQNAFKAGRISHAYLFTGPRGTGKTSVARILARAVNCDNGPGPEPCNQCQACKAILGGAAPDVVEIDAASHRGIDQIRDLRERVRFVPSSCRYRVYVIDEVHMLTQEAFNALLKTLEEPPSHAVFVLATTEPHKIPLTIMSRCQRFDFRRLSEAKIKEVLERVSGAEQTEIDPLALEAIARRAEGSLRDSLSLLDQCLAYADSRVEVSHVHDVLGTVEADMLERVTLALRRGEIVSLLELVDEVVAGGKDVRQLTRDLTEHLRARLVAAVDGTGEEWPVASLLDALEELGRAEGDMRWSVQPRLVLELCLFRLVRREQPGTAATPPSPRKVTGSTPPSPRKPKATAAAGKKAPAAAEPTVREETPAEQKSAAIESPPQDQPEAADMSVLWPKILQAVRQQKVSLHSFLNEARPLKVMQGTLVLGFPAASEVQMRRVEQSKKQLAAIMKSVTGQAWEIQLRLLREEPESTDAGEPLVQETLRLFEGEVVKQEEAP